MNIPLFSSKLKRARELLNRTQTQIAKDSGVKQPHISDMEKREKSLIPKRYFDYLHSQGIDLNSLFDEAIEVRLRSDVAPEPITPALDALRDTVSHIESVAAPPPWLSELLQMNRLVQEMNGRLQRLEDERGKKGPPAESKAS